MTNLNIFDQNLKGLKELITQASGKQGDILFDYLVETLETLLSSSKDEQDLIDDFIKYLKYSDIKYYAIKSILKIIKSKDKDDLNNDKQLTDNVTKILLGIKLPLGNTEKGRKEIDNLKPFILDDGFKFNYPSSSKLYSEVWLLLLSFKLSFESYKKTLAAMDSKIFPHFKSPLSLTDFLMKSYQIGGSISLLSLSSLFLLMTKYNLEYSDFFANFYLLVTPEILHVKYRSRFLYWADIFLSSTNLPSYVAASFVKKFSRLALIASVETLYPLIPLIANILIRHPTLMELFNKPITKNECINDPFDFEETNLKETKALESSLWEIKSLQKHWNANVREKARFINYNLPEAEYDLADLLEVDFPELVAEAFSENAEIDDNVEVNMDLGENALEFFN